MLLPQVKDEEGPVPSKENPKKNIELLTSEGVC